MATGTNAQLLALSGAQPLSWQARCRRGRRAGGPAAGGWRPDRQHQADRRPREELRRDHEGRPDLQEPPPMIDGVNPRRSGRSERAGPPERVVLADDETLDAAGGVHAQADEVAEAGIAERCEGLVVLQPHESPARAGTGRGESSRGTRTRQLCHRRTCQRPGQARSRLHRPPEERFVRRRDAERRVHPARLRRSAHYLSNLNCAQKMDPSLSFTIN